MSTPLPLPEKGTVAVGGYSQAERQKRKWDALLTCEDPKARQRLRVNDRPQLVLAFEDCDDESLGYAVATVEQCQQALEFMRANREGSLLVHCMHGVGRSAALALMELADRLGAGQEEKAVSQLLAMRPEATPNLVVVAHADALLKREGMLMTALLASEAANPCKGLARKARADFARENPELYSRTKG